MTYICLYFKVHQPYRLKKYEAKDIDLVHCYEDAQSDQAIINYVADTCYLPANEILYRQITAMGGKFRISFSISGTVLELLKTYRPDVLDSFKKLVSTGFVEILAETYYHTLSFLHSKKEFRRQLEKHSKAIEEIFGLTPSVFRNTALIHNNELAAMVAGLGYRGLLCEGVERMLQGRSQNQLYAAPGTGTFGLLLRNNVLSDDIAFRFGDSNWSEHPLTAEKFAGWIHSFPAETAVVNLFLDYETIGVHKKKECGIFNFLEALPAAVLRNDRFLFSTPSAVLNQIDPVDIYDVEQTISWEDRSDLNCVWSRNTMQNNTLKKIYALEKIVTDSNCKRVLDIWGRLQAADHFYYMNADDSATGKYENPYESAEEAFKNYTNILVDFEISLIRNNIDRTKKIAGFKLPAFNLY